MVLMGLDASTEQFTWALCRHQEGQWAIRSVIEPAGSSASARLLPSAVELLQSQGLQWSDVQGLAYGQGPGAFTGLRSACAAVQGLALGLGIQAVPVPSLMIVAEDARVQLGLSDPEIKGRAVQRFGVAVDARMGQVYQAVFEYEGDEWRTLVEPQVQDPDDVAREWLDSWMRPQNGAAALAWVGSGVGLMSEAFGHEAAQRGAARLLHLKDRAQALGRCTVACWHRGPQQDAAQVMPVYVRDRVALTTQERLAAQSVAT